MVQVNGVLAATRAAVLKDSRQLRLVHVMLDAKCNPNEAEAVTTTRATHDKTARVKEG